MQEAYLLLGKEEGDKDTFVRDLEKELTLKFNEINKERFFLNEVTLSSVFNLLSNGNLFADYNFYICYNAELLKAKDVEKLIKSYLDSEGNSTIVFLSQDNSVKVH